MTNKTDIEQLRADFEAWLRDKWTDEYGCPKNADGSYVDPIAQLLWESRQAGRAALQSQAQIPAPTNRDEYIALLDRAIDMGKQLNVMWEEAFAEVRVKHGLQSQDASLAMEDIEYELRNMASTAYEVAMSFGVSRDSFERMANDVFSYARSVLQSQDAEDAYIPEERSNYTPSITDCDAVIAQREGYTEGWNDCRQDVIDHALRVEGANNADI